MKTFVAVVLLFAFSATAAPRLSDPPLVPMVPVEQPVPAYARWWTWLIVGAGVAQVATVAGIVLWFVFQPRYYPVGSGPIE